MKPYLRVWLILLVLTAVEVGLAYVQAPLGVMVAAVLMLSLAKTWLIVDWFMHMREERRSLKLGLFPVLVLLILALLALLPDAARAQCIMCQRNAAAQQAEKIRALNAGIAVLVVPPVLGVLFILRRTFRRASSEARPGER